MSYMKLNPVIIEETRLDIFQIIYQSTQEPYKKKKQKKKHKKVKLIVMNFDL